MECKQYRYVNLTCYQHLAVPVQNSLDIEGESDTMSQSVLLQCKEHKRDELISRLLLLCPGIQVGVGRRHVNVTELQQKKNRSPFNPDRTGKAM